MKKIARRIISLILVVCMFFTVNSSTIYAKEISDNFDNYIMSLEGPSTTFEGTLVQNEQGDYVGTLRSGMTTVTCVLSGRTGGIATLYQVYIRWKGTNQVQSIQASNLSITDANMLHDQTPFFSKDFFIQGLSATSGYKPIGTCTIPESISKVHIKTTGLCAYFYNEDFWISLGEINGTLSV